VTRADLGSPPGPLFCSPQGGTLRIDGDGISPMPRKAFTDEATVELPTGDLVGTAGTVRLVSTGWDPATGSLTALIPPGTPAGVYNLTVTNPNGNTDTLNNAVVITETCPSLDSLDLCSAVDPAFGWVDGRTRIEICANNADGNGLSPVPEVFLVIDENTQVPLIREAMLSLDTAAGGFANASVMSAVVPSSQEERGTGVVVGGPYDILVVNPDGAQAAIPAAFTVVADPPPVIISVSPEQAEKGATVAMHIRGANFKDPSVALDPRVARVLFLAQDQEVGAACDAPDCYECGTPTAVSTAEVTCAPPLAAMASSAYLVRYEHLDDGAFGEFASFAITNPSGNLAGATTVMPDLNQARFAHAAVFGRDDLGNRFVYVVGGQSSDDTATALASVEVAALSRFGDLSAWTLLPVTLPAPLTGLTVARQGDYLFAAGGRDAAGAPVATVYRARILGDDSAPVILAPDTETGGNLAAGTYSYRVSAVMAAGTDNEGGETLASDAETVLLTETGSVRVRWQAVTGASSYRVFRTAAANELAGTEVLLTTNVSGTSYLDNGSDSPGTQQPMPAGGIGEWMSMLSLETARADAGATIAEDTGGAAYLYVLGGVTAGSTDAIASYELASMTESAGVWTTGAFVAGTNALDTARAEFVIATLSDRTAPLLTGLDEQYVVTAQGLAPGGTALDDISLAKVGAAGQLETFVQADSSNSADRYGSVGVITNNFLFSIAGRRASGGEQTKGLTVEVCPARTGCDTADPPVLEIAGGDSGITLQEGRYRAGGVYVSGYFYFMGGAFWDNGLGENVTLDSVERGGYAQ